MRCIIAPATPQIFTVVFLPATLTDTGVRHAIRRGCAVLSSPDPPGTSWWLGERLTLVLRCSFPCCLPDPAHLAVQGRPVVRAAVHPRARSDG